MKVGVVGCGYVFDHYMSTWSRYPGLELMGVVDRDPERVRAVTGYYGLRSYPDADALLADPLVDLVVNLTSTGSHFEVSRAALEAGKHVYSEKPLSTTLDEAEVLLELAEREDLRLSCAPSNALSSTALTMWQAVRDGAVGDVRIVYAEFDDNPIYLMDPEGWRSVSGAPWPYLHEYEMGCTVAHVGYHLTWMCAIFGPVSSVTAFSKQVLPDKTDQPLEPPDTPDFSVACLDFESGVVGRVTCSIGAPLDHRMRIIGNKGMLHADTYRDYNCPVYLEPFTKLSLNARKARSVRTNTLLQAPFGVGGRRIPPVRAVTDPPRPNRSLHPGELIRRWKRRQLGQQDKCAGIAELAHAVAAGRPHFPPPDFTRHLTELTLAIQEAGTTSGTHHLRSRFAPIAFPGPDRGGADYTTFTNRSLLDRMAEKVLDRLHRH